MTLFDAKIGKSYYLIDIQLDINVKQRLEMLGMTPNAVVNILEKKKSGTMIIKIRGTRYAIGKKFVKGIIVGEMS